MTKYYGIIYMCTNQVNQKRYIGKTIQPLKNRMTQHKSKSLNLSLTSHYFYNGIRKYGWDNFVWEIIDYAESEQDIIGKEKRHIKEKDTFYKNNKGYNMTLGGEGTIGFGIINEDTAYEIKVLLRDTSLTMAKIGTMFGVSLFIVDSIYRGVSWSYVEVEGFSPCMKRSKENREWDNLRLTDETVKEVKKLLRDGIKVNVIAKKFDTSEILISQINMGRIWRHIEVDGFFYSDGRKYGHEHVNAILSEDDVIIIKKLIMEGGISLTEIAAMYNVNKTTISRISKGKTYVNTEVEGFVNQDRNSKGWI
ncbi:GIY-YIG nuclease family protein [Peribacillus frigoritolerans]|uniref:GIY-YIG nuclease family protein n=1 Tax=Peribacillus frigoritolerans TaxID=450367 RepID=UPI003D0721E4